MIESDAEVFRNVFEKFFECTNDAFLGWPDDFVRKSALNFDQIFFTQEFVPVTQRGRSRSQKLRTRQT